MHRRKIIVVFGLIVLVWACNKTINDDINIFRGFEIPAGFPQPVYDFANNVITKEKFELGKKLFNDPILSANNTISCAGCHIQTAAFTHNAHSVSQGINDRLGTRNTPAIMNLAWYKSFMWDGGVFDLDLQPIAPITNHVEMADTMEHILSKLKASDEYVGLFKKAYGDEGITTATFLKSLSQFMLMCISAEAKYDSVMDRQAVFTNAEQKGYILFKQKCSSCHTEPLFTDNSFHNNGLTISRVNDAGRYNITLQNTDRFKFKTPGLRNLSFTAPYMHDGRFFTLQAVLDHYTAGMQNTQNIDSSFKQNNFLGIRLSDEEKQHILAFLKTLDDRNFLMNTILEKY